MSAQRRQIPEIEGVKDPKSATIFVEMKGIIEDMTGRGKAAPISTLGANANLAGLINKVNEIITTVQGVGAPGSSPATLTSGGLAGGATGPAGPQGPAGINGTPGDYFVPLVWTSGADLVLGVGQSASASFTAATSMPLHIACGNGQIYEMEIVGSYTPAAATIDSYLQPNNAVPTTNSFALLANYASSAPVNGVVYSGTLAAGGFTLEVSGSSVLFSTSKIFTSTLNKKCLTQARSQANAATFIAQLGSTWNDTSTVWSSLGTVIMPNAWTGIITLTRVG